MPSKTITELELFYRFVRDKLNNGGQDLSPEESLQAFRAHQEELERLRQEIQPSLQRSLRGESELFDAEKLKKRVSKMLAKKGIRE